MDSDNFIHIKGAAVNNLKNISLDIPRDKFVVITGISGSGKSSLAFDTLFAEGQRRFAESISSFARQFLGRMSKPAVEDISGIPPAIAIEQRVSTGNPRSTVGTSTEIYDYLRILFAKIGRTYSPVSGREVACDTSQSVLNYIREVSAAPHDKESMLLLLANIKWEEKSYRIERLLELKEQGYNRVCIIPDNHSYSIEKIDTVLSKIDQFSDPKIYLLVDRISLKESENIDDDTLTRITDSINTAFERGNGYIQCIFQDDKGLRIRPFSNIFESDGILFEQPQEWLFNFNNPLGACPACGGFGKIIGIDEELVIPNQALSVYQNAIACWKGDVMQYFKNEVVLNAEKYHFPIHKPYHDLSQEEKDLLWKGNQDITGILPFFKEIESKRYKIQNKYLLSRYSGKTICRDCHGSRLRKESLYVKIGGKNIAELMDMSIHNLRSFFDTLTLTEYERSIASKAIIEINQRLEYIENVGLSYLTLNRASNTLSGGESQRIHLVSTLGNSLTGSMYILDEPSIGLHSRDTARLISVLKRLRDIGNTVIVVEHDEDIIRAADYLIDIGPLAGINGGEIVYQGPPPATNITSRAANTLLKSYPQSLTLQYLLGKKSIPITTEKRHSKYSIEVCGACENNLKNIDVRFPLKVMTAVVGVSGSGKSSLVGDILYPALFRHINKFGPKPGSFSELRGDLGRISSVEYVDQNPIGKNSRSNPVTYLKVYDDIRKVFSDQPYAKLNGYGHSHFSFNIDGGRCPECQGEGTVKIPMQFMADITMTCESCGGKRFLPDILEVKYHGKNISDVLDMSVDEAIEFFSSIDEPSSIRIAQKLRPLQDVGLNYIRLGQSSSTLSGGESQRVKLASFLGEESASTLFIFDEPTTGLHFHDIEKLLNSFNALLDHGHTIVVVEHNPYIIRAADNIIELGPEGGDEGGYLLSN